MATPADTLPANVQAAIQQGRTVEAIKLLRESSGLGLKEAKEIIDDYSSGNAVSITSPDAALSPPAAMTDALQRGNKIEAIRLLREQTGLGLKEAKEAVEAMPHQALSNISSYKVADGAGKGWVFALAILGLLGYFLFYKS